MHHLELSPESYKLIIVLFCQVSLLGIVPNSVWKLTLVLLYFPFTVLTFLNMVNLIAVDDSEKSNIIYDTTGILGYFDDYDKFLVFSWNATNVSKNKKFHTFGT